MINNSNLKNVFTVIALKLFQSVLTKYWKIFYYIFWWNLKNLTPINFKIFFKRLESRYNVSKNFYLLNVKQSYFIKYLKQDFYVNNYLNNFIKKYNTFYFINNKVDFFNLDEYLEEEVYFETNYSIYYNFYPLKYLN